jgi:hypothetical protein
MLFAGVFLAVTAPCLRFKPLNLLPSDLMLVFAHAQEDFFFFLDRLAPYAASSPPRLHSVSM